MSKLFTLPAQKRFTRLDVVNAMRAISIERGEEAAKAQHIRINTLMGPIKMNINIFIDEWAQNSINAVQQAQTPPDERSHRAWFLALFGNLMWAATCFVGPEVAGGGLLIKVFSGIGATVGSGTITELAPVPNPKNDAKNLVIKEINGKTQLLEKTFNEMAEGWAWELDSQSQAGNQVPLSDVLPFIWSRMYPNIPYLGRRGKIYDSVKKNAEEMLQDFDSQWRLWLRENGLEDMETTATWFKYVAYQQNPFRPNLEKFWKKFAQTN